MANSTYIEYTAQIRDMLDIRNVAETYGLTFNHAGFTHCVWHKEKTASLKVQNKAFLHCFGCGINADAIKLTQNLFGLRFTEAVRKLDTDFCCGILPERKLSLREQRKLQAKHKERLAAQKSEQRRKDAWEAEYWTLFNEWVRLDRNIREHAPKSINEDFDPLFVEACCNIAQAEYVMQCLPPLQDYIMPEKKGGGDNW